MIDKYIYLYRSPNDDHSEWYFEKHILDKIIMSHMASHSYTTCKCHPEEKWNTRRVYIKKSDIKNEVSRILTYTYGKKNISPEFTNIAGYENLEKSRIFAKHMRPLISFYKSYDKFF